MSKENKIEFRESLFSKCEQDYFNYHLNKSEFIDGLDIRNSNLHGTQSGGRESEVHYTRYMLILKLIILMILKINDELCLAESINCNKNKEK